MASFSVEDLCCPVCQDVFRDPVLLPCSHSFCDACLRTWWAQKPGLRDCPVCRKYSQFEPAGNLALKNLCEAFTQNRTERDRDPERCRRHSEKLRLFCVDHERPVCLVCRDSEEHHDHSFRPVEEAAGPLREELRAALQEVRRSAKSCGLLEERWEEAAKHVNTQAKDTQRRIQEEFRRLHRFLEEEEEVRIRALQEEAQQKSVVAKEEVEAVRRHEAALRDTVTVTEEGLKAADVPFLLTYRAAVQRVRDCSPRLEAPTLPAGALIDVAKHLGNLSFNIWSKMKDVVHYSPVVLDPNTASLDLVLSEDLSTVNCEDQQLLPRNPERLKNSAVLSWGGFSSGVHSWEVEVGANMLWELGVLEESALGKKDVYSGLWRIGCYVNEYKKSSPSLDFTELSVQGPPRRIRVELDQDRGVLSFFDPDRKSHIHTYMHTFTDKIFPFFSTIQEPPLKILPVTLSVAVGQKA